MKQFISFRVDSGMKIGFGHVMRCLTLADAFNESGFEVVFMCRASEFSAEDYVRSRGYSVVVLAACDADTKEYSKTLMHADFLSTSQYKDAQATMSVLDQIGNVRLVVVDHYGIYRPWDEVVGQKYKILKLDDLADREHLCDALLDSNFYHNFSIRYKKLVPNSTMLLLGPEYALLRRSFLNLSIQERLERNSVNKILISFGGIDHHGFSYKISTDILKNTDKSVVIMGKSSESFEEKWQILRDKYGDRIEGPLFFDDPMPKMMEADLFIGAGGTTTWERFACGIPSIIYSIAINQIKMAEDLHLTEKQIYAGTIEHYNWFQLHSLIEWLGDKNIRRKFSIASRHLVDGQGAKRVIQNLEFLLK